MAGTTFSGTTLGGNDDWRERHLAGLFIILQNVRLIK